MSGHRATPQGDSVHRILAAAERAFAEQGLAGARTDAIASAAGVNKALLYYYFGSKERLYTAVLRSHFEPLREVVRKTLDGKANPKAKLLRYVESYFGFLDSRRNYPLLLQREMVSGGRELEEIVKTYFRPAYRRLVRVMEKGIKRGEFRKVDVHNAVITLIALTVFYFGAAPLLKRVLGRDAYSPKNVARRKASVFDFLEHGLMRRS